MVTYSGFWVQRDGNAEHLSDPVEKVASHPQLISHRYPLTVADLELPLARGHF